MFYAIAKPNAYLAITGAGIDNVVLKKKSIILPFQRVTKFSITPFDFELELQAMTAEKLKFTLPAVFTIGPQDDMEALEKYAVLLTGNEDGSVKRRGVVSFASNRAYVQELVNGILEGEIRMIVSNMTMAELFDQREMFRDKVLQNIQSELDQFGLKIYNANVKELRDSAGQDYFVQLGRRAHETAINQAKVDVAEAKMKGRVGEALREGETKQEIAKIEASTAISATERKKDKAQADAKLADTEISIEKGLKLSRITAQWAAEERDAELQKNVETKRAEMELERQRADEVTKAIIARESKQQRTDAEQYSAEKAASTALYQAEKEAAGMKARQIAKTDAKAYDLTREAEANRTAKQMEAETDKVTKLMDAEADKIAAQMGTDARFYADKQQADAEAYAAKQRADAKYYSQKQEAQGMMEMAQAYGAMANALGGPQGLMQYLMLRDNTYEKLANANAKAIQGLQPKISVWNTGADAATADATAPIRNLFQSLPPLLDTISDQTGMKPPNWLVQMPQGPSGTEEEKLRLLKEKAKHLTNGASS